MASKKELRKLAARGRKVRFAEFAGRTKTAVGQWAKGRFRSPYLDAKIQEWDPPAPCETERTDCAA
jgi:hypothetical protein